MNIRHLAVILFRLTAIFLFYSALINCFRVYGYLAYDFDELWVSTFSLIVLQIGLPLIAGLVLWFFPNSFARLIIKPAQDTTIQALNGVSWLRLIVIGIGFYWIVWGALDAIYWSVPLFFFDSNESHQFMIEQQAAIVTTVAEIIVGMLLLAKNTWIAQFLWRTNQPELTSEQTQD